MTVSSTTARVSYSGNGSTVAFSVTFYFLADTDLKVVVRASDGTETVKVLDTDYTVTGEGNPSGGTVTFGTAPASSTTIVIVRNVALTQNTDYQANDPFPAETHEEALDRLTMIAQQQQTAIDRVVRFPVTDSASLDAELPPSATRANKLIKFDSSGNIGVTTEDYDEDLATVAAIADDVSAVAAIDSNVTTVAGIDSDVTTVAGIAGNVTTVAGISADVTAVAGIDTDDLAAVADIDSDVTTVAGIASDVTTVSGINAAVSTVADNIADIQNAEENADAAIAAKEAAESAQSAAEAARDATLAAYDNFDDRYLGAKTSDPSVDNDGNALVAGALYFNSDDGVMKLWTGSAWVAAYVSGDGFLTSANNLSDLTNAGTALTNLGGTTTGKAVFTAADVSAAQQALDLEVGVDVQAYDATIVVDADIGVSVQAYDADTAKTDVAQTFTISQRGTVTTDNDLSFDLAATNNFKATPTGNGTLTFTNIASGSGQSGFILLVNSGGYTVSAHANTKVSTTALATISAAGSYIISYFSDGTNVYCVNSGALA